MKTGKESVRFEVITPEIAKRYLEGNVINRKLQPRVVDEYVK